MDPGEQRVEFEPAADGGGRLDVVVLDFLAADPEFAHVTRSQIKQWIEEGRVALDGETVQKAGSRVKGAQRVCLSIPPPALPDAEPIEMPLSILYEDGSMLVLNKPAGISMHSGAGGEGAPRGTGICRPRRGAPAAARCGLGHRLDKDTTGVVIVAKSAEAQAALARQFAERTVEKQYAALVFTTPRARRPVQLEKQGLIVTRLGRHPRRRTEMAVLPAGGREAVTAWERLEEMPYATLLAVRPKTGRTHQIRVHMAHILSPIIGDRVYGDTSALPSELRRAADAFGRQALHAERLACRHPVTGAALVFEAPPPEDFGRLLCVFREFRA